MSVSPEYQNDFDALPPVLRLLLAAELAAGNSIVDVGHSHPAPPVGAYFLLARQITTRARASGNDVDFYERNGSHHSGEFTDAKRFFFILEPPLPPEPEPNMDAIRAAMEARQREADRKREAGIAKERAASTPIHASPQHRRAPEPDVVAKFRASMELDYERWKEGTSYALDLIKTATPEDRASIETIFVTRGVRDWRDVEALAVLDTLRAREVLRETVARGSREHAIYVLRHAPHLVTESERTATLVAALEETDFYGGLTQTLLEVQAFHPPAVIAALLRGVLHREKVAAHFAAMLLFLHGKATSPFDWDQRPYFLRFNTPDRAQREALFRDLCARLRVAPEPYLLPA